MKSLYSGLLFILYTFFFSSAAALFVACGNSIPDTFSESEELPNIYPDYTNVTIPLNIAPLTFQIDGKADNIVARLTAGNEEMICSGRKVQPDMSQWRALIQAALNTQRPSPITVEVFVENNNQWTRFKPFNIFVSPDSIDTYISYRLISPSYVTYEELTINQRCLENYDESVIYDNMLCSEGADGQCINCHNYQQYNPDRMQFHARQKSGGTVIAYDGKVRKINMKNDSILSAGVYPTWHPWLKYIVYSTNLTAQSFHVVNPNKIEVFDTQSDLIAYDVDKNEVTNIENDPSELECFPFWAPDGKSLYYCSAHFEYHDTIDHGDEFLTRYKELKYSLYKKSFNPETLQFGPRELVFNADTLSATLPRISPDGRFLMFTLAPYGVFHIWHHDADLWMIDLGASLKDNGESTMNNARPLDEINSDNTESYHSWSSNGRWVVFSSRRYDGNYTRPFIAHIDNNGHGSKPFELPCADPDYHRQLLKCYNIPEFMYGPVTIKPQQFADVIKRDGETVKYKSK